METLAPNNASFQSSTLEKKSSVTASYVLKALTFLPGLCFVLLMILGIILSPFGIDIPASPLLIVGAQVVFVIQLLFRLYKKESFEWSNAPFTVSCIAEAIWTISLIKWLF